ncbi:unnamed protein product [Adineta steineri]|uniref:ZP-C domain-containing protein n=1 Tax=Adineta steineri TaxID=433720 RepID=A0A814MTY7_9BILA|nr:unnamed protein product [Adineta steineri]
MYRFYLLLLIGSLWCFTFVDAKRRATSQSQHNLGDFCMPGTCASLNSNCKRIGGNAFRCVCKEQYMAINKTHCVRVINASVDEACGSCIKRNGICLDENSDDRMEKCFCPTDNDLCNDKATTTYLPPITQSLRKNIPGMTQSLTGRISKQGDLVLSLYDINQQRIIDNGGSVFIGDRLFIEIKYRTNDHNSDRHQIIAENCSVASSVTDNEIKLEKIQLLTNRCPTLDSRLSIRFQRIDPYHLKSTIFSINKFQTTSIVYLRCSIAICFGQVEKCVERLCPVAGRTSSQRLNSSSIAPFDYVDEDNARIVSLKQRRQLSGDDDDDQQRKFTRLITDLTNSFDTVRNHYEIRQIQQQFSIEIPLPQPTNKRNGAYETLYGRTSLASQGAVERSTVIAAISIIFIIGISVSLFIIYRTCYVEYVQKIYGSPSLAGFINSPESIYGGLRSTSQVCRYDMGRRSEQRFDESFFVSNVEPLGAYRRQY